MENVQLCDFFFGVFSWERDDHMFKGQRCLSIHFLWDTIVFAVQHLFVLLLMVFQREYTLLIYAEITQLCCMFKLQRNIRICLNSIIYVHKGHIYNHILRYKKNHKYIKVDLAHPSGLNQVNHPALDMVGQGGEVWVAPILCKFRTSIHSHHMASLPTIHHPMLHTLLMRMLITPLLYSLRASNPNLVRHRSLNPRGRHMRHPETTIQPTLSLTSDIPLRGKNFMAYPCQTLWGAFSIAHNHNPCILWWEEPFLLWWKGGNLIIYRKG